MSLFPEVEPYTREYDLGDFPVSVAGGVGGGQTRFLHGGEDPIGGEAVLGFQEISGAELRKIRNHYRAAYSTNLSFFLPEVIWRGHPLNGILPTFGRWRYVEMIEEEHGSGDLYNISVRLLYVGLEPSV